MPKCGSQVILCDLPVRFDTYAGCSHACSYCFANRNRDIRAIKTDETPAQLRAFIEGKRHGEVAWVDWDIPLHWGGMSDPFQPIEKYKRVSLECLKVFRETQYPFVVSTKNALIASDEYLDIIKDCNCVVQFSAVCPKYDDIEKGASTFAERVEAASRITPYKRVNIRVQPYALGLKQDVLASIEKFSKAGVHGVVFEGMKYITRHPQTIKLGGDWCYPSNILARDFQAFKNALHAKGMKFYCGENRLRGMSDELCCCGVEGLGWKTNTANLNHFIFDRGNYKFTPAQKSVNAQSSFRVLHQSALWGAEHKFATYEQCMQEELTPSKMKLLLPDGTIKK